MTARRLRSDLFWSGAELVLRYGVQFATLIVLARLISPSDFGLMAMAMIVVAAGNVLSDSGMTVALTRLPRAEPVHFASAQRFGFASGACCIVLGTAVASPLATLFHRDLVAQLLIAASFALPAVGATAAPDARLIREGRFATRAKGQLVASVAGSLVAVGLALCGAGPWALVGQFLTTAWTRWVMLEKAARTRGAPSLAALRSLLPMSGYLVASGLLDVLALRSQAALLGRLFGTAELGFFSQAQSIQQVPTTAFSAIVNKVALPRFVDAAQRGRLKDTAVACLQGTWLVFCPGMVLAALLAQPLVPLVLGERWSPMAAVLSILCVAASLWPVHVVNLLVCTARGDGRSFFYLEVAKKLILLAVVAGFGWRSPVAMAGAVAVASLLGGIVNATYSGRAIGYGALAQTRDLLPVFLAAVAGAAVAIGVDHKSWPDLLRAAVMAATFVIIYAVAGVPLGRKALRAWRVLATADAVGTDTPPATSR